MKMVRAGLVVMAVVGLTACQRTDSAGRAQDQTAKSATPPTGPHYTAGEPARPDDPSKPSESLAEPSSDVGGVLPLKHGYFVSNGATCEDAPNAALRRYDGKGLSGAHTRDCQIRVLSAQGKAYSVEQSCVDAGEGPAPRSSEDAIVIVESNVEFTLQRKAGQEYFQYCPASSLPPGLPS